MIQYFFCTVMTDKNKFINKKVQSCCIGRLCEFVCFTNQLMFDFAVQYCRKVAMQRFAVSKTTPL